MKTLNMNFYDKVAEEDATLRIKPNNLPDGTELPYIYLKGNGKGNKTIIRIKDVEGGTAVWSPGVYVDIKSNIANYKTLVDWWFKEAYENVEYRESIVTSFGELKELNIRMSKAIDWLMYNGFKNGKKNIDEFLTDRLTNDLAKETK